MTPPQERFTRTIWGRSVWRVWEKRGVFPIASVVSTSPSWSQFDALAGATTTKAASNTTTVMRRITRERIGRVLGQLEAGRTAVQ